MKTSEINLYPICRYLTSLNIYPVKDRSYYEPHSKEPSKYELTIDGVDDSNWFRQKQKEFLEALGIKPNESKKQQRQRR